VETWKRGEGEEEKGEAGERVHEEKGYKRREK
jgi:hypothetical protein